MTTTIRRYNACSRALLSSFRITVPSLLLLLLQRVSFRHQNRYICAGKDEICNCSSCICSILALDIAFGNKYGCILVQRLIEMRSMNAERSRGEREKKERRRQDKEAARMQQQ